MSDENTTRRSRKLRDTHINLAHGSGSRPYVT